MNTKEIITTRVLVIAGVKISSGVKRRPRIRIAGFWLKNFGFTDGTLVTGEFEEGRAILRAVGSGVETYSKFIGAIRKNGGQITQVKDSILNKKMTPHFEMTGLWLTRYGFNIGDVIVIYCHHGLIEVIRLDIPNARGFR